MDDGVKRDPERVFLSCLFDALAEAEEKLESMNKTWINTQEALQMASLISQAKTLADIWATAYHQTPTGDL